MQEQSLSNRATRGPGADQGGGYLDPALWSQLGDRASDAEFCGAWLQLVSTGIVGVRSGIVVLSQGEGVPFVPVAVWPPAESGTAQKHSAVVEGAVRERKGVVIREGAEGEGEHDFPLLCIAFPVQTPERILAVVALRITPRSGDALQAAMRQLQWDASWIENRILRKELFQAGQARERIATALEFVAGVLEEPKFNAAAPSFATLLATRLQADRVSIGFLKGEQVKVRALSHSSHFTERMNLVRGIADAMAESIDQESTILFPVPAEAPPCVSRAHAELSSLDGECAICTVPFFDSAGKGLGAITLERGLAAPFSEREVELCEAVAAVVGPILEAKRRLDRPLPLHAAYAGKEQLGRLLGPRHPLYKAVFLLLVALTVFFSVAQGNYRIAAKTTVEGAVLRVIAAPFDGFIAEAPARPGDVVRQGDILARLDDREKKLERARIASQKEQYLRQYREALATGNRVQMRILRQQMAQADAQTRLLDHQIAKAVLVAPFDALVVSGDLSQALGAPVEKSKILFEVAPLKDYRVRLHVDEQRVADLKEGQQGTLILNSLPDSEFPITVRKITPVSVTAEGKNQFLVEASLDRYSTRLRPGMEGVGKILVGKRLLVWVWTHETLDWLRLWVWSWLP